MKNDDRFGELEALDSWQLVHEEQDIRGCTVASVTGTHYGTIEDMLVDKEKEHVAAVRLDDGRIVALAKDPPTTTPPTTPPSGVSLPRRRMRTADPQIKPLLIGGPPRDQSYKKKIPKKETPKKKAG